MDATKNVQENCSNGQTPVDKAQESARDAIKSLADTKNMDG